MNNFDIKKAMFESGLKQWELANLLGISESTLCRKLRFELSGEEKVKILKAIAENKKSV